MERIVLSPLPTGVSLDGVLFAGNRPRLLQQIAQLHRLDVYIFIYSFSLFKRVQKNGEEVFAVARHKII